MVSPKYDVPKEKFINDFTFICGKNDTFNLNDKIKRLGEYATWNELPIREKIEYLETFNVDEKDRLRQLWHQFGKWIDADSMLISVKIHSNWATTTETPFEGEEDFSLKKKPSKALEKKSGRSKPSSKQEPTRPSWRGVEDNTPKTYVKYTAEFGRIVTARERTDDETRIKKLDEKFPVYKCYQLCRFEFSETHDGRYFYRSYIKDTDADPNYFYDNEFSGEPIELGDLGSNRETAIVLSSFMNLHQENFVEELDIDVKYWGQEREIQKFRYIKKFTLVHNSPTSTNWWLRHVDTMKTIPEVTILGNYKGDHPSEKEFRNKSGKEIKKHESMPFVIPFENRVTPIWVEYIPQCENPIFWAEKLTFENTVDNTMSELAKMSSLAELNINRSILHREELNEFLKMWSRGEVGHRLQRVTVNMDYSTNFISKEHNVLEGVPYITIKEKTNISPELRKIVGDCRDKNKKCFVIYREFPSSISRGTVTRGAQKQSCSSGYGSEQTDQFTEHTPPDTGCSTPYSEESSEATGGDYPKPYTFKKRPSNLEKVTRHASSLESINEMRERSGSGGSAESGGSAFVTTTFSNSTRSIATTWNGGSCALLEIDSKHISFTAVQNEQFAQEFIHIRPFKA